MRTRHLLLAVPFFLLVGCAGETASESSNAPAETSVDSSMAATPEEAPTSDASEIPAWETDGPVDEAAASARDIVLQDLDALRKAGEEMFLTNPDMSDGAIRDEVVKSSTVGSEVVADGASGIRVTAVEGEISCSGVLEFKSGAGTWNSIECS